MRNSAPKKQTSKKKASTAESDRAKKLAFQELCREVEAANKAAREKMRAERYAAWRGAAKRFKGLSDELTSRTELRNIHPIQGGYMVSFARKGEKFAQHFPGDSEESLSAAMRFRDKALKILGEPKTLQIPARVLEALGLSTPVIGVARDEVKAAYSVSYKDKKGKERSRKFSFSYLPEEDAYAAAIEFLEETLKRR